MRYHNSCAITLRGEAMTPVWPVLLCLLPALTAGCNNILHSPGDIMRSQQLVSQYRAVFTAPPKGVPSFHAVDGPITGNGDIGLTVSGSPEHQRYWISKNDFWKSGPDFHQCGPSLIGGIDVDVLRQDEEAIRREVKERVPQLLNDGGYIPLADGRIRADISYENYAAYRLILGEAVGHHRLSH